VYMKTITLRGLSLSTPRPTWPFEPGITCVVGHNGSGKSNGSTLSPG